MRSFLIIAFGFAGIALADTVTFSESTFAPKQFCGSLFGVLCAPYSLDVPQFDPSVGTLESISYSLTDLQTVGWGWNDITAPVGSAFHVDVTASASIVGLPIDSISTIAGAFDIVTVCQCSQIATSLGPGPIATLGTLTASGSFFAPSFIGTGTVPISFTDTTSADTTPLFPVFSASVWSQDVTTLDITYAYSPVPEPSQIWFLLVVSAGILFAANSRFAAKHFRGDAQTVREACGLIRAHRFNAAPGWR